MKTPESPPSRMIIGDELKCLENPAAEKLIREAIEKYLYWSEFKYKTGSIDIDPEILWGIVKLFRNSSAKRIKISDLSGFEFKFNVTADIFQKLHEFDLHFVGIPPGEEIIPANDKNQYLISSIMEEAIASSQIEGAATTRKEAKKMLREERKPKNKSEQMILNNYNTIKKLKDLKDKELTKELLKEIHSLITKDTLNDPGQEGFFRESNDIIVVDRDGDISYVPPDYKHLDKILNDFCIFANETNTKRFIHPVIRAAILHFLIGYIHPFTDGNGRTARAIFYWYLLKKGYWLIEYISISRMIIKSRGQYSKAYLFSELDENDLTYFIIYQLKTLEQAFYSLKEYINRKIQEKRKLHDFSKIKDINDRQIIILKLLSDDPEFSITIKEVQNRFNTVYQTARTDLMGLEKSGLIQKRIIGRKKLIYHRSENFNEILSKLIGKTGST
ncbi:hypothetical protein METP3_02661 [Methanosarcinales archaeon]|nr:hypothetical protein METP3_02661 [Methanosarcinales archaeon]